MKISNFYRCVLIMALLQICHISNAQNLTQYVNPFIGTADNGHTFPGAAMPL